MTPQKLHEYQEHNQRINPHKWVFYCSPYFYETACKLLPSSVLEQWYISLPEHSEAQSLTAIKTQKEEGLIEYSDSEQVLINRYDKLDRSCKRTIGRHFPSSWQVLELHLKEHERGGHKH